MQPSASVRPRRNDPLQYTIPLPFEAEYCPLGFPLRVASNRRPALAACEAIWSRFPRLFDRQAMRVHITVEPASHLIHQSEPVLRGQGHLFSIVADRSNFVTADLRSGFGHICVSAEVAAQPDYLRYHFLEPLVYVLIAARHVAFAHASCIALNGRALILSGPSGTGKTCLAYACARRGWTFLSGDAVAIPHSRDRASAPRIVGRPFEIRFRHTATRLFPELAQFPRELRPSGKTDIEIDPAALGVAASVEGTASGLVFLRRTHEGEGTCITPIPAAEARELLEEGICFGDESVRGKHGRTFDWLTRRPAVRLDYSNLDDAEAALRAFAGSLP